MKRKLTFAICAIWLLAGFLGLMSLSEAELSAAETFGIFLAIVLAESPAIIIANREIEEEGRS